ncbi:MAG: transglycosylase domain-containing protein, partial [Rhodoferax sp.]|nr:transglycosylase domain-containing protein [Rhodoferax sp.]
MDQEPGEMKAAFHRVNPAPSQSARQAPWACQTIALFLIATQAYATPASGIFDAVKSSFTPSDTLILDRQGELLHRQRTDFTVRRGQWVGLADVSPALRTALIFSEDKRFYEHSGVDWQAASSAAWANLWNT